jgi:hypothetical protein
MPSRRTTNTNGSPRAAIIDGSNVAHSAPQARPRLDHIQHLRRKLEEEGYEPIVIVDAALRHQIDDAPAFEALEKDGRIRQAPAGTDADWFILTFARELDAVVVSNDRFREYRQEFPEFEDRQIRFMIVDNEVVLRPPEDPADEEGERRRGNGDRRRSDDRGEEETVS